MKLMLVFLMLLVMAGSAFGATAMKVSDYPNTGTMASNYLFLLADPAGATNRNVSYGQLTNAIMTNVINPKLAISNEYNGSFTGIAQFTGSTYPVYAGLNDQDTAGSMLVKIWPDNRMTKSLNGTGITNISASGVLGGTFNGTFVGNGAGLTNINTSANFTPYHLLMASGTNIIVNPANGSFQACTITNNALISVVLGDTNYLQRVRLDLYNLGTNLTYWAQTNITTSTGLNISTGAVSVVIFDKPYAGVSATNNLWDIYQIK